MSNGFFLIKWMFIMNVSVIASCVTSENLTHIVYTEKYTKIIQKYLYKNYTIIFIQKLHWFTIKYYNLFVSLLLL